MNPLTGLAFGAGIGSALGSAALAGHFAGKWRSRNASAGSTTKGLGNPQITNLGGKHTTAWANADLNTRNMQDIYRPRRKRRDEQYF